MGDFVKAVATRVGSCVVARFLFLGLLIGAIVTPLRATAQTSAAWDSVATILKAPGAATSGYVRFGFPRRDITLKIGDVTVATSMALGSWAGFSGDPARSTMMGDLVLTSAELKPVLAELEQQDVEVSAVHNHLVGATPEITYVHFHARGPAMDLAQRLDRILAVTATPRPVAAAQPAQLAIDTALVFSTLGVRGRAQGTVAQVSTVLVPGNVSLHGRFVNAAMAYGTPINIQMLDNGRAVATGDYTVLAPKVDAVVRALTNAGITVTALHSHLVGEQPQLRYIHFWADDQLESVLKGLRAAIDAAK